MKPSTPAAQIPERDLGKNVAALRQLLETIPANVRLIVDARYGLGGWARVARDFLPDADYVGYEADSETWRAAWKDPLATVYHSTTAAYERNLWAPCDLLLADFNTVTQLKRAELDEEIKRWDPEWLIFTDVACGKLHLNFRSYGLEVPDLGAYWRNWDVPGYSFEAYAKHHHAASTGLFRRI